MLFVCYLTCSLLTLSSVLSFDSFQAPRRLTLKVKTSSSNTHNDNHIKKFSTEDDYPKDSFNLLTNKLAIFALPTTILMPHQTLADDTQREILTIVTKLDNDVTKLDSDIATISTRLNSIETMVNGLSRDSHNFWYFIGGIVAASYVTASIATTLSYIERIREKQRLAEKVID